MRSTLLALLVLGINLNTGCAKHMPPTTDPTIVVPRPSVDDTTVTENVDPHVWLGFMTIDQPNHQVTFLQWTGEGVVMLMPAVTVTGELASTNNVEYYRYVVPFGDFVYTEVRTTDRAVVVLARLNNTCSVMTVPVPAPYRTDNGSVTVYKASLMEGQILGAVGSDCSILEQQGN